MIKIDHSLKLANNQFYPLTQVKKTIALHHSAGFSAESAIHWWNQTPQAVGTPYVIERDGTIYEAFDPRCWAYHLGISNTKAGRILEGQTIGIELVALGHVELRNGRFIAYGREIPAVEVINQEFRGYDHYQVYTPEQITSLIELLKHLSERFNIPLPTYGPYYAQMFEYNEANIPAIVSAVNGPTLITHAGVRKDKTDPFPYGPLIHALESEFTNSQKDLGREELQDRIPEPKRPRRRRKEEDEE